MTGNLYFKLGGVPVQFNHFASYYNTQLPRFNSRYYNPGVEAVDTSTCGSEMNWWCPPMYLIPRILRHVLNCQYREILVVLHWLICPIGELFAPFVCDWCDLPQ